MAALKKFSLRFASMLLVSMVARAQANPSGDWQSADPAAMNFSPARIAVLREWLKTEPTTAMMVVVHGKVIFSYGDVTLNSKIASIRKSVLSLLYGPYISSGKIDLNQSVVQLGLEDHQPFLPIEQRSTLLNLMTATSGIYLPSGNTELDNLEPRRGSVPPGSTWAYNNWDFNAAGTAFEKLTGKNIYDAVEADLARPLGMQDFDRKLQVKVLTGSVHPEYAMFLSTRDMARIGLLALNHGRWNGKSLISAEWIGNITSVVTHWQDLNPVWFRNPGQMDRWGYGILWWVWDTPPYVGDISINPFQGAFSAMGTGGQFITVIPQLDMVIAHKVNIDKNPKANLDPIAYDVILNMLVAAHCKATCP